MRERRQNHVGKELRRKRRQDETILYIRARGVATNAMWEEAEQRALLYAIRAPFQPQGHQQREVPGH